MEKIVGIYKITNLINQKVYVGLSRNCQRRWYDHRSKSKSSPKEEDLRKPLYLAMRKYGLENFSFEIIEVCEESLLSDREVFWIDKLDSYRNGYNATLGGDNISDSARLSGERHGMAKLKEKDVIFCRKEYVKGSRSRDIWEDYYSDIITFAGFQKMWHGRTWKKVMPEVFEKKQHTRKRVDDELVDEILTYHKEKGTSIKKTSEHFKGRAGYGTVYSIITTNGKRTYSKRK